MSSPISVFVRTRPLTPAEGEVPQLAGLCLTTTVPENDGQAIALAPSIGGFTGVLGQESSNADVFARCFADRLGTILAGGAASLFCYGYTGGGKTHTAIGYGEDRGLFFLAAERLLAKLTALQPEAAVEDERLFLRATACEVYNDVVYDLLGEEKLECALRTNQAGQLSISRLITEQMEGVEPAGTGEHATLLTVDTGLRSAFVKHPEHLQEIHRSCVTLRASGQSTTHHQSSRSHAILGLEVVNAAVLRARDTLQRMQAQLPALQNAKHNSDSSGMFKALYSAYGDVLRPASDPQEVSELGFGLAHRAGDLWVKYNAEETTVGARGAEAPGKTYALRDVEGGEEALTLEDWALRLGTGPLVCVTVMEKREFPGGESEWEEKRQAMERTAAALRERVAAKQQEVDEATTALRALLDAGPAVLGGRMELVDLAGADYDHRSGPEQKESAQINKSLLALKECFRSLANVSGVRPKFRESKLTRILEDSLAPTACSARRNRESVSVMVVNISPAASLEKGTINALRYGQMYAGRSKLSHGAHTASGGGPVAVGGGRSVRAGEGARTTTSRAQGTSHAAARDQEGGVKPWHLKQQHTVPLRSSSSQEQGTGGRGGGEAGGSHVLCPPHACDPALLSELWRVYKEHVPEKSEEEVETIIARFAGREAALLQKVTAKYMPRDLEGSDAKMEASPPQMQV